MADPVYKITLLIDNRTYGSSKEPLNEDDIRALLADFLTDMGQSDQFEITVHEKQAGETSFGKAAWHQPKRTPKG